MSGASAHIRGRPARQSAARMAPVAEMLAVTALPDFASSDEHRRDDLEALIREDYERCHPGDTLRDLKRRAKFSKEDRGLLRDWRAVAEQRERARLFHMRTIAAE
jgi:hypothetical protein